MRLALSLVIAPFSPTWASVSWILMAVTGSWINRRFGEHEAPPDLPTSDDNES